nr:reverse transcriptase domain-containing protein [Tanacetum cinerariifolium]
MFTLWIKWHPPDKFWEKVGYPVWHHKYKNQGKQNQLRSKEFEKSRGNTMNLNHKRIVINVTSGTNSFTFTSEQFKNLIRNVLKDMKPGATTGDCIDDKLEFVACMTTLLYGDSSKITQIGQVRLKNDILFKDVLCVPSFKFSLLSDPKLTKDNNCVAIFFPNFCVIQDLRTRKVHGLGRNIRGMYHLLNVLVDQVDAKLRIEVENSVNSSLFSCLADVYNKTICPSMYSLWHHMLGHISVTKMKHVQCFDVPLAFLKFLEMQFDTKVKCIRSYNSLEFVKGPSALYLADKGIEHQPTCVDRPQMVGWKENIGTNLRDVVFHEHIFPFAESSSQSFFQPLHVPMPTHPAVYNNCKHAIVQTDKVLQEETVVPNTPEVPSSTLFTSSTTTSTEAQVRKSTRKKARLMVQGNRQMKGIDYEETFSPVAKMVTVRSLLAVAGKNVQYVKLSSSNLCKLKKSLYGLKQAPRQWFTKLSSTLLSFRYHHSKADYSLFTKKNVEGFTAVLVYVDDLIITGLEVTKAHSGLYVSQKKYTLEMLQEADVMNNRPYKLPMDPNLKFHANVGTPLQDPEVYRRYIGKLIYLTITRPEICYTVYVLSQFMRSPTSVHMQAVKHLLRYLLNSHGQGILLTHHIKVWLIAYCDSDWARCPRTRRSTIGLQPIQEEKRHRETQMLHLGLTSRISVKNITRTSCQSLWTRFAVTSKKKSMLDRIRQAPRIVLAVEAALTGGTLLMEIVLRVETPPVASKNHMITPTPPTGQGPTTNIAIATETAPAMGPRGSRKNFQSGNTGETLGNTYMVSYVQFYPNRGHESMFDELLSESIYNYKDLKAAFLAYFMQQKKYVKDPVEIHNIKQKDRETIEDFMERFKVETGRMKRAPECMRISGFMHGVNNPELTKCLNEHVPKTMEEMMITTTAFIRGEVAAAGKKKVTHHGEHRTSQSSTLQRRGLTSEVSQGKEWGLAGLPPYKDTKRNSRGRGRKVPAATTYGKKVTQSFKRVREITFPSLATSSGTEGTLVIEAKISGHMIHHMYVDGGSSTKVLYENCFNRLRQEVNNQKVPATTSLTGFSGETIWPMGQLRFLVTIGDADHSTRAWMNFMIVRSLSVYNGIIGRPGMKEIQAVPSTAHGMLKFTADGGIVTICSAILIPAECATVITSSKEIPKEAGIRHENFKVALHLNFLDQEVAIRGTLSAKRRTELCSLLKENLDIFAWQPSDMTGPLPEIDWKVKSLYGYPFKCFLDAYKGYHQIQLVESDEEKTDFHTGQGVYCYTKMPFGLKNAGATYQWLVDKAFDSQIGQNIEVYVDDLVIKSHTEVEILRDIDETFRMLRKINMKLNPKKCMFGEVKGMFLGYMIIPKGIKSWPDKTEVVLQLPSAWTIKEVQSLNGKLASLNRFPAKTITKMKRHAGRTQYHIPTKDVGERTGPSRFPRRDAIRKSAKRISGGNSARAIDTLHEWIVMSEYEALIAGLRIAAQMGVRNVHSSHGDTPFSLTYGMEAVIRAEIGMPTYRTTAVDAVHNDEELRLNLDLLEEQRERAAIREAKAKLKMTKYYNARVRGITFKPGNFVYRSNDASHAMDGGKLNPKWEGPYEVTKALGDGAYKLRSTDGTVLPRTWNIANLKKCYL